MAGIQNIDFSQKLSPSSRDQSHRPAENRSPLELSRLLGWGLAGAILIFTGGILAGLKIADLRNIERNLVKYPDGEKRRSFANVSNKDQNEGQNGSEDRSPTRKSDRSGNDSADNGRADSGDGSRPNSSPADRSVSSENNKAASYIIRIGAWRPARAGELARSLNALPDLSRIPFHPCKGITDLNPERAHVFPVPADDRKTHRLFAGCYTTKEEAAKALDALKHTGVGSLKEARVYELSE